MKQTRYAIWIDRTTDPYSSNSTVKKYWWCQGSPKDPTNFGFAILYDSVELAERALRSFTGRYFLPYAKIIPVECNFSVDI